MNVYAMNECDWYVGESLQSCIATYIEYIGDPDCVEEPYELDEKQLLSHTFFTGEEDEEGERISRSFKSQLAIEIAAGGEFPRFFASTEY